MLQHETLIVLDRKAVLLLRVGGVLFQLELKLVDEHLCLFLVINRLGLCHCGLVTLFYYRL